MLLRVRVKHGMLFRWKRDALSIWSDGTTMRRYFFFCIAAALHPAVVAAALAEENGRWELEQRGKALFALSYKQSASQQPDGNV
jgi:hypothetical protein